MNEARDLVGKTALVTGASRGLGRFGQPEEIADVVHGLTSPSGRWVTAQIIDASGGYRL